MFTFPGSFFIFIFFINKKLTNLQQPNETYLQTTPPLSVAFVSDQSACIDYSLCLRNIHYSSMKTLT